MKLLVRSTLGRAAWFSSVARVVLNAGPPQWGAPQVEDRFGLAPGRAAHTAATLAAARMSEALMSVRGGSPKLGLALPALDLFGAQRKAVRNGSHHQDERDHVQHGLVL